LRSALLRIGGHHFMRLIAEGKAHSRDYRDSPIKAIVEAKES
jgi:hypothetical protein